MCAPAGRLDEGMPFAIFTVLSSQKHREDCRAISCVAVADADAVADAVADLDVARRPVVADRNRLRVEIVLCGGVVRVLVEDPQLVSVRNSPCAEELVTVRDWPVLKPRQPSSTRRSPIMTRPPGRNLMNDQTRNAIKASDMSPSIIRVYMFTNRDALCSATHQELASGIS
jgi:hypothetical protein